MKRNKQQKYRIKIIQEFNFKKLAQKFIDYAYKDDYVSAYYFLLKILKYRNKSGFKPTVNFELIDDIDRNSIIPNMIKPMSAEFIGKKYYYKLAEGDKNA